MSLAGKNALVCGASQGIGRATARLLAQKGARVLCLARSEEKLKNLVEELPGQGHSFLSVDVTDRESLSTMVSEKISEWGAFQVLVCNSGGPKGGPLIDASPREFVSALEAHVLANQMLVQLLVPGMQASEYGRVINIISTSVKTPIPNLGVSNTIRGAVASWAKTLANELGPLGITVNNVLPGFTETERLSALKNAASKRLGKSVEEVETLWKSQVPLRRFAKPEELAEAVVFLAGDKASYINGVSLPVDGGRIPSL